MKNRKSVRYTLSEREGLLAKVKEHRNTGMSVEAAIRTAGINRATYYKWATKPAKKVGRPKKIRAFSVEAAPDTTFKVGHVTSNVGTGFCLVTDLPTAVSFFTAMRGGA